MSQPVLIIIDVQTAADDPKWGPRNNPEAEARIADLLGAWRSAGAPVWHIRHDSIEPDSPYRPELPTNAFKPQSMPEAGEPVTGKTTNSAFIGTDFEAQLKEAGHSRLVMCGVQTNNCVESSVRHAGNLGFETYVVSDACWTSDKQDLTGRLWTAEDVHQLSLAKMQGEYAEVIDSAKAITMV